MIRRLFALIVSLFLSGAVIAASDQEPIRPSIVGGSESPRNAYPWMVALIREDEGTLSERQFCGGALIHPLWILTAAHCVNDYDFNAFEILVNSNSLLEGEAYQPAAVFLHPESDIKRIDRGCDLALIRLRVPITHVEPVAILRAAEILTAGKSVRSVGWGSTEYDSDADTTVDVLREVDLTIQNLINTPEEDPVHDYFVMAEGNEPIRGTASGDSGGPLIVKPEGRDDWMIAGVVSFGVRIPSAGQTLSFFASVPYAADWIGSLIDASLWQKPETPLIQRIEPQIDVEGEPVAGYRIWPFADGAAEHIEILRPATSDNTLVFELDNPDFKYNGDGSFTFLHRLDYDSLANYQPSTSLVSITQLSETSLGNNPIAVSPHIRVRSRYPWNPSLTFSKRGYVFELQNLEPHRTYEIVSPTTYSKYQFFEISENGKTLLFDIEPNEPFSESFVAQPGHRYWIYSEGRGGSSSDLAFSVRPTSANSFNGTDSYSGTLSETSPVFKNRHTRAEQVSYTGTANGEVRLQVYSEYDTEIAIYRKVDNALNGYYDVEIEGLTEEFIVSSDDLREGLITLFNFDKNIFGNFTLTLANHTNSNLIYDRMQKRAITRNDPSYSESGDVVHYETFTISDRSQYNYIKVDVLGRYFSPGVAVYDGSDLIEFQYGSEDFEFEFESSPNTQYTIEVYDFEGPQNANFEITVTGSANATLAEETNPQTKPLSFKKRPGLVPTRIGKLSQEEATRRIRSIVEIRKNRS